MIHRIVVQPRAERDIREAARFILGESKSRAKRSSGPRTSGRRSTRSRPIQSAALSTSTRMPTAARSGCSCSASAGVSHGLTKERRVPSREIDEALERKQLFEANPKRYTFEPPKTGG